MKRPLNQCPKCNTKNSLVLCVDAYDTSVKEGDVDYDITLDFELNSDLGIKDPNIPNGIYTYDKDRTLVCSKCQANEETCSEIWDLRAVVREKNEGWL